MAPYRHRYYRLFREYSTARGSDNDEVCRPASSPLVSRTFTIKRPLDSLYRTQPMILMSRFLYRRRVNFTIRFTRIHVLTHAIGICRQGFTYGDISLSRED